MSQRHDYPHDAVMEFRGGPLWNRPSYLHQLRSAAEDQLDRDLAARGRTLVAATVGGGFSLVATYRVGCLHCGAEVDVKVRSNDIMTSRDVGQRVLGMLLVAPLGCGYLGETIPA